MRMPIDLSEKTYPHTRSHADTIRYFILFRVSDIFLIIIQIIFRLTEILDF